MSFPCYEAYQESDVELLGEIPTHWDLWKLAHAFTQIGSGTTPKSDNAEYYDEGTIPWVNTGDLDDGPLNECAKCITEKALHDHSTLKMYPDGSLLFAMYGATIGKLGLLRFPATVNQACCVFSGDSPISVKFLFYWFLGLRQMILSLATGGGQPNVSQDILRTLKVACPDKDEQRAIASFLDEETSKIDCLVSEQRRLIELLKEKRQAVISHAVTKGLNPNAPMKPSGIQWLGDVPEHWDVSKIKYECQYESGHTPSKSNPSFWIEEDCHIPWVSLNDTKTIDAADFIDDTNTKISEVGMANSSAHLIDAGAVVFTRDGARVGLSSITTKPMCVSQHIIAWVCGPRVSNHYLLHVIYAMNAEIYRITAGSTIPTIGMPDVKRMTMPLPPIDEQSAIVDFLVSERERFATLIAQAERAIELLKERRTALISAAVTGKIDVRGFVSKEALP